MEYCFTIDSHTLSLVRVAADYVSSLSSILTIRHESGVGAVLRFEFEAALV